MAAGYFRQRQVKQGRILQPVTVVGRQGSVIRVIYHMLLAKDGRWLINGVYTTPAAGTGS